MGSTAVVLLFITLIAAAFVGITSTISEAATTPSTTSTATSTSTKASTTSTKASTTSKATSISTKPPATSTAASKSTKPSTTSKATSISTKPPATSTAASTSTKPSTTSKATSISTKPPSTSTATTTTSNHTITPETTVPPPTTPNGPCSGYMCANNGNCSISYNSQIAYCKCNGNLDENNHCFTGGCPQMQQVITSTGPFYSPNYNGSTGSYTPNSKCRWYLKAPANSKIGLNVTEFVARKIVDEIIIQGVDPTDPGSLYRLSINQGSYSTESMAALNKRIAFLFSNSIQLQIDFNSGPGTIANDMHFVFDYSFSKSTEL